VTQITLRGLDPQMEDEIRKLARKSGKSLNRVILDLMHQYTGLKKKEKKSQAESLRKLAGGWSEKDALEFQEAIKSSEQIDEEMWR
jgi:gas vesicle protein